MNKYPLVNATIRYFVSFVVIFAIWWISSASLGVELIPEPIATLSQFCDSLTDETFLSHMCSSTQRLGLGLIISILWGFSFGLILGYSEKADWLGAPLTYITYPLPKVVFLPVFFTLLGIDDASRVALIALTSGYQIMVIVRGDVRSLDPIYTKSYFSMGGSTLGFIWHVLVPSAIPALITGLKVVAGTALAVLFIAESFATNSGLGWLIMDAWGYGDIQKMFVGILGISLLGVVTYLILGAIEYFAIRWTRLG